MKLQEKEKKTASFKISSKIDKKAVSSQTQVIWIPMVYYDIQWRTILWNLDSLYGGHAIGTTHVKSLGLYFCRVKGGGSLKIWASFCFRGQVNLNFLKLNSAGHYTWTGEILQTFEEFLPNPKYKYVFHKDNVSINVSHKTKIWFNFQNAIVFGWHTRSS